MADADNKPKTCFVIMPISDVDGYVPGHFQRVYDHLIKPAAIAAGFDAIRADEVSQTNYIMVDVLKRTINSDMAICDLSTRNPNVLFELGIRQAFNKPVTLIKDTATPRIFDIQGLRTLDYTESLRIDTAEADRSRLIDAIMSTAAPAKGDVNSLIEILGVAPANLPHKIELTERDSIIMNSLRDISDRVAGIERKVTRTPYAFTRGDINASDFPTAAPILNFEQSVAAAFAEIGAANETLSSRELAILRALHENLSVKQIAGQFNTSMPSIQSEITTIFKKLSVTKKGDALEAARQRGLVF